MCSNYIKGNYLFHHNKMSTPGGCDKHEALPIKCNTDGKNMIFIIDLLLP